MMRLYNSSHSCWAWSRERGALELSLEAGVIGQERECASLDGGRRLLRSVEEMA